jgi:hypothetical protein
LGSRFFHYFNNRRCVWIYRHCSRHGRSREDTVLYFRSAFSSNPDIWYAKTAPDLKSDELYHPKRRMIKMKRIAFLTALMSLFGLVFLVACSEQKEAEKPKAEVTSGDVKKEAEEAMEAASAYTQQQKEDFMRRAEAKMEEYNRQMEELTAKAQSGATELSEQSKAELNQDIEELRKKKQEFAEKLDDLKSASGQAWDDIKSGTESAMDELGQAINQASSRFKQ